MGPRLGRTLLVVAVVVFLSVGLFPAGPVRGVPAGAPSLLQYFIVGNGAALVAVGYVGWLNSWVAAPNGSSVFAPAFYIVLFNLRATNSTVTILATQGSSHVASDTIVVPALSSVPDTVSLPQNTAWTGTTLYFDGVPYWSGQTATPISLLPNYILNVGGLDLFALVIVYMGMLYAGAGWWAGKRAMKRAGWAPHVSVLAWGHVAIGLIAGALVFDYQFVDQTFAGFSPVVYPLVALPIAFLTSLSYFNRAESVEILAGTTVASGEMGWHRTSIRIARIGGRLAFILGSWGAFWARYWRHQAWAESDEPNRPKPWLAPVLNHPSPTDADVTDVRRRAKAKRAAARSPLSSADALTRFPVIDPDDRNEVHYLAFAKSDVIPKIRGPRLSFTKLEHRDAEYRADPSGGPPIVVKRARDKRRLTWPHYIDPPPNEVVDLEDIHFAPAAAVWAGFASIRDLGRVNSKNAHVAEILSASFENRIQDEVHANLRARYALIRRATSGITESEAAEQAKALPRLVAGYEAKV